MLETDIVGRLTWISGQDGANACNGWRQEGFCAAFWDSGGQVGRIDGWDGHGKEVTGLGSGGGHRGIFGRIGVDLGAGRTSREASGWGLGVG